MTGSGSGEPSDDPDQRGDDRSERSLADADGRDDELADEGGRRDDRDDRNEASDRDATPPEGDEPAVNSAGDGSAADVDATPGRGAGRDATGRSGGSASKPASHSSDRAGVTIEDDGLARWLLRTDRGSVVVLRDLATSVLVVALIGVLLFGASGVWPPLVAVESGSMEPNMERGDLVFVVDEQRYVGDGSIDGTGVVTYAQGAESGHEKFGEPGDVIIFYPNGDERQTPVIHRAYYWVEEGDDWVERYGDERNLNGNACSEVPTCPARHDGFVTMGDANQGYDQIGAGADTDVVRPEWITGKAMFRVPWLGYVRLTFDRFLFAGPVTAVGASELGGALVATGALVAVARRRC